MVPVPATSAKFLVYYTEKQMSHTFIVDKNSKVMDLAPVLFKRFFDENHHIPKNADPKSSIIPPPNSASESITQYEECVNQPPALLITGMKSWILAELIACRERELQHLGDDIEDVVMGISTLQTTPMHTFPPLPKEKPNSKPIKWADWIEKAISHFQQLNQTCRMHRPKLTNGSRTKRH